MVGALMSAKKNGIVTDHTLFIEIGPHSTMSAMIKSTLGSNNTVIPSLIRDQDVWKVLTIALSTLYCAGANIHWKGYHHDFVKYNTVLDLPAYAWDLKDYWIKYENDWSLSKAGPTPFESMSLPDAPHTKYRQKDRKLESSTIHTLVHEDLGDIRGSITVESDVCRSDLRSLAEGHRVNSVPLCTPVSSANWS